MTLPAHYSSNEWILLDFVEGFRQTETYACQPDLAAATDLLLEALAQANTEALTEPVWDCLWELESQANHAGLYTLRKWVWELRSLWVGMRIWDLDPTESEGPQANDRTAARLRGYWP